MRTKDKHQLIVAAFLITLVWIFSILIGEISSMEGFRDVINSHNSARTIVQGGK